MELVDRPGDQASAVLRALVELPGGLPPEDITLGVPDEEVVPFLEQRLGAYGIPSRYAGGLPLSRTPPYRFLAAVGSYLEEESYPALAELLRHPVFLAHAPSPPSLETCDEFFLEHLPGRLGSGALPSGGSGGAMEAGLASLLGPKLLGPLGGRRTLSAWMPEIMSLLARIFGSKELSRQAADDRRLLEAFLHIRERAQSLHELPRQLDEECTASEAIRILLGEMDGDALPPEALEEAIELVGWLELHLDDAPVLFITGVNEGTLPGSVGVDPFLPNELRGRLRLPDNRFRFGRDAYILSAILHSRQGRVKLISGRRNAGGDPLRPSRLLLTGEGKAVAERVLRFSGEGDPERPTSLPEPLGISPAPYSRFRLPPEPTIPVPEIPRPIPVTQFRSLLSDPYIWALESLLKLGEVSDEIHEMDPLAFGSLAHRVLEIFGRSPEAASHDVAAVRKKLEGILDRVTFDTFGDAPLPAVPIQVAQLRARLHSFARWQAEWVREGWRVEVVEGKTVPEGAPFVVDGEPVYLSGRIDRIDFHPATGSWVIFDYKTGETTETPDKTHRDRKGWKDLQLPLYRHLLPHLEGVSAHVVRSGSPEPPPRLGYLPLTRKEAEFAPSFATWDRDLLEDADETARNLIRQLRQDREVHFQTGTVVGRVRESLALLLGKGSLQGTFDENGEDGEGGGE